MLESGADVHATDKNGETAIMQARANGYDDITEILIKHGADPKSSFRWGSAKNLIGSFKKTFGSQRTLPKVRMDLDPEAGQAQSPPDDADVNRADGQNTDDFIRVTSSTEKEWLGTAAKIN